jgi:hypothetical protein
MQKIDPDKTASSHADILCLLDQASPTDINCQLVTTFTWGTGLFVHMPMTHQNYILNAKHLTLLKMYFTFKSPISELTVVASVSHSCVAFGQCHLG